MKLRIGILLWALSWVPYGLILGLSGAALTVAWGVEITLGIVGIALVGTEFRAGGQGQGLEGRPEGRVELAAARQ